MQLNIFIISNPIINKLCNQISHYGTKGKNDIDTNISSQLKLLLIYEVLRKWINIQYIYIKDLDYIKEICIYSPTESYLLLTNVESCSNIIPNIKTIMPKLSLIHTYLNLTKETYINIRENCLDDDIIGLMNRQKIIIMENILNNYAIMQLLDYLIFKQKINIHQIKIICIICTHKILKMIGSKYPLLNIYTAKITN
uniref:Uracil phosphoribosyltransferase n=1 Tax=Dicranema revolutum TaxID=239144 RepID=A0A4D6WUF6_9FLOR|nr:hypothetical protein [Dicranema revolutum]